MSGSDILERLGPSELLQNALVLMRQAHDGALRDEGTPYIRHPLRVALILVEELGISDIDLVCTALLHDALEDCKDISYDILQERFGTRVGRFQREVGVKSSNSED